MTEQDIQEIRAVIRQELGLGFGPAYRVPLDVEGGTTEQGDRYCWGVWNHVKQVIDPEMQPAITGYIEGIGVKEVAPWKGERKFKLILRLDCGAAGSYSIRSGLETAFSKGLVGLVASLGPSQARSPVKIAVRPGDDESGKVVLCSMYAQTQYGLRWLKSAYDYPKEICEIRSLFRAAVEVVPRLDLRSREEREQAEQRQEAA